jgi:hypothetical protein
MFIYLRKKAQSTAEYVIILGLVVGAVVAMQTYIKRGLQGRVREAVDFTDQGGETDNTQVVQFDNGQYEPYYLSSKFESRRIQNSTEDLNYGGSVNRELVNEHSYRHGNQIIAGDRHSNQINE